MKRKKAYQHLYNRRLLLIILIFLTILSVTSGCDQHNEGNGRHSIVAAYVFYVGEALSVFIDSGETDYGDIGNTNQFEEFFSIAKSRSSDVKEDEDEVIELSEDATLSIIDILDGDGNTNNNLVISVLDVDGKKMLIMGDYEDAKNDEDKVPRHRILIDGLREVDMYPIDIYVVGHHGSDTSSSKELLDFIKPTYALISSVPVGRNQNPDPSVLQRLSDAGTEVYSTYLSGDIKVMFENGMISIATEF